jgi:transposase
MILRVANQRRFVMAAAVALRGNYDAATLRRLAHSAGDPGQVRRLLALAAIYAGSSRSEAAAIGGVGLQTVRDWVLRFNAEGPAGLETGKAPGNQPLLGERERAALRRMVEAGPTPAIHGVVRWRIVDLMQWLWEEFRLSVSKQTMSRELRALGSASSRRGRVTMPRTRPPRRPLKKLRRECGADRGA